MTVAFTLFVQNENARFVSNKNNHRASMKQLCSISQFEMRAQISFQFNCEKSIIVLPIDKCHGCKLQYIEWLIIHVYAKLSKLFIFVVSFKLSNSQVNR